MMATPHCMNDNKHFPMQKISHLECGPVHKYYSDRRVFSSKITTLLVFFYAMVLNFNVLYLCNEMSNISDPVGSLYMQTPFFHHLHHGNTSLCADLGAITEQNCMN